MTNTSGTSKPLISALGNEVIFYNGGSTHSEANNLQAIIGTTYLKQITNYWDLQTLFSNADNELDFRYNGSSKMIIDSSGNVGIGTTSPISNLTVPDYFTATDGTRTVYLGQDGNGGLLGTSTNHYTRFITNNTERMRIDSSGDVGIGESSPLGKLHVKSADSGASADGGADELVIEGSGDSGLSILSGASNNGTILFSDSGDSAAGGLRYEQNNTKLNFRTNGGWDKLVIDGSGNLGIGTDSPSAKVHLKTTSSAEIGFGLQNSDRYYGIQTTGGALTVKDVSAGGTERMRIDSTGRLIVNQTSASAAGAGVKMQVNSDILTRGQYSGYFWENRSGITITTLGGWGGWYSTGTTSHFLYSDGSNKVSINRSTGAYTALSDVNKKKDFEDSTVGLAEVMQLQPKKFRMLDDAENAPKKLGFVAQDVENVIPEAYVEDLADDENEETFIGLTDTPIIAALTKAIQEQQTLIENLTARIEQLEN